jgi:hypothetical protein
MKKTLFTLSVIVLALTTYAQVPGSIRGKVINSYDKQGLPGASITLKIQGNLTGTISDTEGNFDLRNVPSGVYEVEISYIGYDSQTLQGVRVYQGEISFLDNILLEEGINIDGGTVIAPREPLLYFDDPNKIRITSKTLESFPDTRNIPAMLASVSSSFYVSDDGSRIHVRGGRRDDSVYIIDGIRVQGGDLTAPGRSIGSITMYAGGVPAAYGDFTGGVIVIETKSYFDWLAEQNISDGR